MRSRDGGSGRAGKMAAAVVGRVWGSRGMEAAAGSCRVPLPAWWGLLRGLLLAVLAAGEAGWERDSAGWDTADSPPPGLGPLRD